MEWLRALLAMHPLLGLSVCGMLGVLGLFGVYLLTRIISYGIMKTYKDLFHKERHDGF